MTNILDRDPLSIFVAKVWFKIFGINNIILHIFPKIHVTSSKTYLIEILATHAYDAK